MLRTIFITIALTNFAYQAFGAHDWWTAIDRTYFQGGALAAVGIAQWLTRRGSTRADIKETP